MIANGIRHEFFAEIGIGTLDTIDAPEALPAGGAFGGGAPVYTGHYFIDRPGRLAQCDIDAFGALFGD